MELFIMRTTTGYCAGLHSCQYENLESLRVALDLGSDPVVASVKLGDHASEILEHLQHLPEVGEVLEELLTRAFGAGITDAANRLGEQAYLLNPPDDDSGEGDT